MTEQSCPAVDAILAMDDPTEGTLDDLALRLRDLAYGIEVSRNFIALIQSELAARMEDDVVITRFGPLVRKPKRTSQWRDGKASQDFRRDVLRAIRDEIAIDKVTGEREPTRDAVAQLVLREVDDALPAFSSLKVAGQRRLRIDVNEYREWTETLSVSLEEGTLDE